MKCILMRQRPKVRLPAKKKCPGRETAEPSPARPVCDMSVVPWKGTFFTNRLNDAQRKDLWKVEESRGGKNLYLFHLRRVEGLGYIGI